MKNVRDVLTYDRARHGRRHRDEFSCGAPSDALEPVYASSKWAINCFVQTTRRQVFHRDPCRLRSRPGPWSPRCFRRPGNRSGCRRLVTRAASWSRSDIADTILFMLTRPRHVTIRDVVMLPTNFDL